MVAAAAVLLPVAWMAAAHQWLGLGEFPEGPITIYLARSTSLLYAIHGFLMLYTAVHLRQYFELAKVFGYLHIAIGLVMLGYRPDDSDANLLDCASKVFQFRSQESRWSGLPPRPSQSLSLRFTTATHASSKGTPPPHRVILICAGARHYIVANTRFM